LIMHILITEFPSPAMRLMVHPWIASSEKLIRETGYRFKYNTREVFEDFVRSVKVARKRGAGLPVSLQAQGK